MHLLLLLLGIVLAAAGAAMLRYSLPIEDVAGAALFTSGMVGIVGALIVIAIAVAVRKLGRIAERLEIQPLPLPPVASVEREDPAPRQVKTPATPAAGARPSLLGWLGRGSPSAPPRAPRSAPTPTPSPEPVVPATVDLTPLARLPEPSVPAPAPIPPPPMRPQPKPAPVANGSGSTVYRAGVIDGMAYTLFMDGSIQAELPTGTVKFSSVDDLQKYLLGNR